VFLVSEVPLQCAHPRPTHTVALNRKGTVVMRACARQGDASDAALRLPVVGLTSKTVPRQRAGGASAEDDGSGHPRPKNLLETWPGQDARQNDSSTLVCGGTVGCATCENASTFHAALYLLAAGPVEPVGLGRGPPGRKRSEGRGGREAGGKGGRGAGGQGLVRVLAMGRRSVWWLGHEAMSGGVGTNRVEAWAQGGNARGGTFRKVQGW
jgi:hypothetical protein